MAASNCIVQDMAGARVDIATAISVAVSMGAEAPEAATLIMAAASGMAGGLALVREREAGADQAAAPVASLPSRG